MSRFNVHPDIAKASTLSKDFYLDEALFQKIKHSIFSDSWQFVGDTDMVQNRGDVYPFVLLENFIDEPLILSRDKFDQLHCLSNVCTHRAKIVVEKACNVNHLQCRYHGRRFAHDGEFIHMPEFNEVENFPTQNDNLQQLPLARWGKWLFTSLYGDDPAKYLQEMMERMSWLSTEKFQLREDLSQTYNVECNWSLYCENYLEGFHIPFVHGGLNAVLDFRSYTTELFRYSNLQLGLADANENVFDLPETSPDYGKKVAAYYFWVFPNMMFNFYPWGLSINIVRPVTISTSKVSFITYVWDESKLEQGAGSDLFTVEMEDEQIVQSVQKGIRSRFYSQGRYSVNREQGVHHFHQLLAKHL